MPEHEQVCLAIVLIRERGSLAPHVHGTYASLGGAITAASNLMTPAGLRVIEEATVFAFGLGDSNQIELLSQNRFTREPEPE